MAGISIHQSGKTFADFRSGLEDHLLRENEKDAARISEHTDSYVDVTQTQYNLTLYLDENEVEQGENGRLRFTKKLRDEFAAMNQKRKSEGLRAKQKNANIGSVDTLQLSDDVLEAMGYQKFYADRFDIDDKGREIAKRKPWSEQTEEARRLVVEAYAAMVEATNDRPDLYGKTVIARLHVDESTPHVERVARMVDRDDYEFNASNIINGNHLGKGLRGKKWGQARQDHFAEKTREILGEEFATRYRVQRGEKGSAKAEKTKNLDLYDAALEIKAASLEQRLLAARNHEAELKRREEALRASESRFNERWDDLTDWEKELRERDERALKLDELKSESDRYYAELTKWVQKGHNFKGFIDEQIEKLAEAVDQSLTARDKHYLDTALKYATVTIKGKLVSFGRWVESDKAKRRQALMDSNLTDAKKVSGFTPELPKTKSGEHDHGRDFGL